MTILRQPKSCLSLLGTIVAEGKQVICVDGRDYLLEKPLRADVALLKAHVADKAGNLVFRKAAKLYPLGELTVNIDRPVCFTSRFFS